MRQDTGCARQDNNKMKTAWREKGGGKEKKKTGDVQIWILDAVFQNKHVILKEDMRTRAGGKTA